MGPIPSSISLDFGKLRGRGPGWLLLAAHGIQQCSFIHGFSGRSLLDSTVSTLQWLFFIFVSLTLFADLESCCNV